MKACILEPETTDRARVEVGGDLGYVWLEAGDREALDKVLIALNEYDDLIAQRGALVTACEAWLDWIEGSTAPRNGIIDQTHDALALVRGEGDE